MRDLTKLSMEELIGSLMTHELNMAQKIKEEIKRKRIIAFKSMVNIEKVMSRRKMMMMNKRVKMKMKTWCTYKFKKFLMKKGLKKKKMKKKNKKDISLTTSATRGDTTSWIVPTQEEPQKE